MKTINFIWPQKFQTGATHAGFKTDNKLDMCWIVSDVPGVAAGVYTKNQFQAAPVQITKASINHDHQLQALIINSGNANSFTKQMGIERAKKGMQMVADKLNLETNLVGVASTGIIGKQLDMNIYQNGVNKLTLSKQNYDATQAILTTDTASKTIAIQLMIDNQLVTVTGFAKGSGMIHPNMGTTLGFILTDANVDQMVLQHILSTNIVKTFNQITVDGCMSTNDMVVSMANGAAGNKKIKADTPEYEQLSMAYQYVLTTLAKKVARDGEGANKLVEVEVKHAATQTEANQVAKAIVGSNLVKAMLFGSQDNWGRIVQAIGQTHAQVNPNHVNIAFNEHLIVRDSQALDYDSQRDLESNEIKVTVDLNIGDFTGTAWGCDLSYKYVEINAAYEG